MVAAISPTSINTVTFMHLKSALSKGTIAELKELGVNISGITSEAQARRIIEEKTQAKEPSVGSLETDIQLDKIYQRIKNLALRLDVTVSSEEKIETMLSKIRDRIAVFEENKNDSNLSTLRAEYDSIKYTYETLTSTKYDLLSAQDILSDTKKALLGIKR